MLHTASFKLVLILLKFSLIVLLSLGFNSFNVANAAIKHSAKFDWYTIESRHFRVHYHNGEAELARQTANIAERVHSKLSSWIQWQPLAKTDLVLSDEFDRANGFATPFPSNRSQIYVSAPDTVSSLEDYASWLETLITHEYVHILHLDKATNSATIWRTIFGRNAFFLFNTFPAGSAPGWAIEGLATYKETDQQRGVGRGQSSYFNMLMRLEVANGIKPVHQVNQVISSWPLGTTSYLYGVNYYQFIAQQYGAKSVNGLVNDFASKLFPYRINDNTEKVLDKNLVVVWQEFEDYLNKKYTPQIKAINAKGIRAGTQLSHNGYFDESLTTLGDGRLFYVSYDAQRYPVLMMRYGNQTKKLLRVERGTRLDVHATAGVLLAQPSLCDNSQNYYDLYQLNLESGVVKKLTDCARYRMARWSPDGKTIIAVHNKLGKNQLVLLNAQGRKIKTLWQGEQWQVLSYFDWSADGRSLVAALYRESSGWNLELFNIENTSWTALSRNSVIQSYPVFSLDGGSIYYSAEHDGVYNLFKMSLSDKSVTQLSNVIGGAFYPAPSADNGDLYYIGHHSNGMDVYQLAASEHYNKVIDGSSVNEKSSGVALPVAPVVDVSEVQEYSPWSSLRPRWWFPVFAFGQDISLLGFTTSTSDILERHNYLATLAYDSKNKEMIGAVDYIYDRYWPIYKLHYDRSINILYDSNDDFARTKVTDLTQAEVILPFLGLKQRTSIHFAYGVETINDGRRASGIPKSREINDKFYGAAIVYSNASRHPRSISRNEGRHISFTVEDSAPFKDSFYQGAVKSFDWREFVALGGKQVLALRVVSGRGDKNAKPFQLGGNINTTRVPPILKSTLLDSPFNQRKYNLRGYASGLQALIGTNMNVISAEYRFPLFKLERGFMTPPVGLHEMHAALFYDSGAAWNNNITTPDKYYSGAGVEVTAVTTFFFHARLNIVLGFARGLDKDLGEKQLYLRLGAAF